jgi:hypothetical protein
MDQVMVVQVLQAQVGYVELQNFLVEASWHPKRGLVPVCGAYSVPLTGELTLLRGASAAAMLPMVKTNHYPKSGS